MNPRHPHQPKHNPIVGFRDPLNKHDLSRSMQSVNAACTLWLERRGIRTDGQLMRANYQAGVGRRGAKGRPPEEDSEIV